MSLPQRVTGLLHKPLPEPPAALRQGPLKEGTWQSPLRSERTAALLGMAVGICFAICFVTGLISHYIQNPTGWFYWPSRPVNLYRVTQGLHVITGFATIPLLLAKLWTVYPKFWEWPPVETIAHAVGRVALLVLVGAGIFELVTGVLNVARWYAVMPFFFTVSHYWVAWVAIGSIMVHIGSKLPVIKRGLAKPAPAEPADEPAGLSRRGFLTAVGGTAAVVAVTTAGQTIPALSPLVVFGQRDPALGPQGVPINKSASAARIKSADTGGSYRLLLDGPTRVELSLADLQSMTQHTVSLPISCVEGWSAGAQWTGVRFTDLLDLMGADHDARLNVESLQSGGLYRASLLETPHSRDPLTLLALQINGEELQPDHGFPARLIAPNRPGVLQTKWVKTVTVL